MTPAHGQQNVPALPFDIAHYRITSKLGEGGMGEVWRATDRKLNREVAIKVLPEAFAAERDRLERFTREAQVLASLNHPNIAAIYGVEERALIMELVEGPTLAARIGRGPIPLDEALPLARQIADALEYAHERGIVHRDLKPANLKVTPEGRVKVLDFGLAKALATEFSPGAPESSPTLTMQPTVAGTILGTAAYMAPEQARGQVVDRRVDIWAFGVVLYEMLTGRRAFAGNSVADTLAAVLNGEPDYSLYPKNLPPRIAYLLKRCLRKKLSERLRDIGEGRIWIDEANEAPQTHAPSGTRRSWVAILAAVILGASVLSGAYLWRTLSPPARSTWKGTFLGGPSQALGPRISRDGKMLAFQAMVDGLFQVAVMKPESGNWTVLTREREHGAVQEIAWSPDGATLYFSRVLASTRAIYSVPVLGGEEHLALDDASNPEMLPDGSLLVLKIDAGRRLQIHHFWPETGKVQPLAAEVDLDDISPPVRTFPNGKEAAYVGWPLAGEQTALGTLYALDLTTGNSRRLAPNLVISPNRDAIGFPMAITPDGRNVLLRMSAGDMRAVVAIPQNGNGAIATWLNLTQNIWYLDAGPDGSLYMDQVQERPEALRFRSAGGSPERLLDGIALGPVLERNDGSLLVSSVFAGHRRLAIQRPGGNLAPISETTEETGVAKTAAITKVGERAVAFPLGLQGNMAIAIASLPDGRILRRLPAPKGAIESLASSPDGRRIFYISGQKVWSVSAEGGEPTKIGEADSVAAGSEEIVLELNASDGFHLLRAPLAGGNPVRVGLSSGPKLTGVPLHPAAVGPGGRVVVQVNEPHMWFYRMATVDVKTGRLNLIPVDYDGDIWYPGWTPDGKIIATGVEYSFSLWQMRH